MKHVKIQPGPGEPPQPRPLTLSKQSADDLTHRLFTFLKQFASETTPQLQRIMQANPDPNLKRLICRRSDVPVNLLVSNQRGLMGKMQAIGRKGSEAVNKKLSVYNVVESVITHSIKLNTLWFKAPRTHQCLCDMLQGFDLISRRE